MLTFTTINPFDTSQNFRSLYPLEFWRGGVFEPKLKMDINEAYQLTFKIDPNISVEAWQDLRDNAERGIRLKTETQDLIFVKSRQPQFDENSGLINLGFMSSIYLLQKSEQLNLLRVYTGSAFALICSLDRRFDFNLIGNDQQLVGFACGASNNYDLLKQICEKFSWSWRETGVYNTGTEASPVWRTRIDVGAFTVIDSFYLGSSDDRYKIFTINQSRTHNQPNVFDDGQILINKIKLNYSGDSFTHVFPFYDTSSGASESTILTLREADKTASWVDAEFPIESRYSSETGKTRYYVVNARAKLRGDTDKFISLPYTASATTQDAFGATEINPTLAKKEMYQNSVSFLRTKTENKDYSFDFSFKKIILPFTKVNIRYLEKQKYINGKEITVFDINESKYIRDLTFDLNEIRN